MVRWIDDVNAEEKILWIQDKAGVGKTTLMNTVAHKYQALGRLAATYYFSFRSESLRSASKVIPTLVRLLCLYDERIKRSVGAQLQGTPDLDHKQRSIQAQGLLSPAVTSTSRNDYPLIIIDGLDECNNDESPELVKELVKAFSHPLSPFKVVISCRPERHIQDAFRGLEGVKEGDLGKDEAGVSKLLRNKLSSAMLGIPGLAEDWISEAEMQKLEAKAGALFAYASIVIAFVGDKRMSNPRLRLGIVLADDVKADRALGPLDQLYMRVFGFGTGGQDPDLMDRFKRVVGTILALWDDRDGTRSPLLSPAEIETITGLRAGEIVATLSLLQSVAALPGGKEEVPICKDLFYHKSCVDFLTTPDRSGEFYINVQDFHLQLSHRHLDIISNSPIKDQVLQQMKEDGDQFITFTSKVNNDQARILEYALASLIYHTNKLPVEALQIDALNAFIIQNGRWMVFSPQWHCFSRTGNKVCVLASTL